MPSKYNKKKTGGQFEINGLNTDKIETLAQGLQTSLDQPAGNKNAKVANFKEALQAYMDYISTKIANIKTQQNAINKNRSNLNRQKNINKQYTVLIKKTNELNKNFDKYLLQYMSFIRINPKRNKLLSDLSNKMERIVTDYDVQNPEPSNNYNPLVSSKATQTQNKIMIEIIQSILESTQPIYQSMKSSTPIRTNVSDNTVKKILEEILKTGKMSDEVKSAFNKNISNWIKLLTEIIELNAAMIIGSDNSANKLADLYLDYNTARTNIINLTSSNSQTNANNFTTRISNNKKKNEVFVQELVSEVFRWGIALFKIYKHNEMTNAPGSLPIKASKN